MKKLILIILLSIFCFGFSIQDAHKSVIARKNATDYSDITFWWRCETETLTTGDYTAGEDSTAAPNGGATIDSGTKIVGSNSCDFPTGSDYYAFTDSTDGAFPTGSGRIGFYLYATTRLDNGSWFRKLYDGSNYFYARFKDTDDADLNYTAGGTAVSLNSATNWLSAATWYFVEVAWDDATDFLQLYVNGVSVGTQAGSTLTAFTSGGGFRIGEVNGIETDIHIDNIIISNDYTRDLNALKDLTAYPG